MLPRFGDPDIYPSIRFCAPELPSLHRVPGVGSPASTVLISSLTSCHPSGQARWTLPGRTVCTPPRFAPAAWGAPPGRRPGSLVSRDPHRLLQTERAGSPRFLGEPRWPYAVLSDPGRAPRARPIQRRSAVAPLALPGQPRRHVPFVALSHGLRPRCLRFAGALTGYHPRKTRFRLVASLCRAGFTCRVPYERFPLCRLTSTSLPPFPGLTWRTVPDTPVLRQKNSPPPRPRAEDRKIVHQLPNT